MGALGLSETSDTRILMQQLELWTPVASRAAADSGVRASNLEAPQRLLGQWLSQEVGRSVSVCFTQNRSTMVSCRDTPGGLRLRLHRMFLRAQSKELEALVGYLRGTDPKAGAVLDAFIAGNMEVRPVPASALRTTGRYHHLGEVLAELNTRFFHGGVRARVTWGKGGRRRRRRSIQLGSYTAHEGLIRVHPCLDQAFVPRYYVAWIVYHEMLHEVLGAEEKRGRRVVHPPEFVALEACYPDYARCKAWEAQNLSRLLAYQG